MRQCLPCFCNLGTKIRKNPTIYRADGKGVTFDAQMPETAIVTCDKNMLTTIVRNLFTNAIKFTAKGVTVTLTISPVSSDGMNPVSTHTSSRLQTPAQA